MRLVAALLAVACAACSARRATPPAQGPVVARVDGVPIHADLVRVTAAREGVDPSAALRMLVDEALLASEARRRGLAAPWVESSTRWHAEVQRLVELEVEEPNTVERLPPAELDAYVASRRAQVCHDGLRRPSHVVFRAAESDPPAARAAARAAAVAFRASLVARFGDHPTEAQLIEAGRAVTGATVVAEPLPGIDRGGGMATGGGVVLPFARALWAIDPARPLSEVFETVFGYHVALLMEEIPPSGVPCAAVRPRLAMELAGLRRARAMHELVARLRARSEYRVDRAALRTAEASSAR